MDAGDDARGTVPGLQEIRADRRGNATLYTVAQRAGVSHQTVSRYIKGEQLRPGNRERVARAMQELDYQVNDTARELATQKPRRIGALVFDVDDWAPQRVLAGAVERAHQEGYVLEVVRVDPDQPESIRKAFLSMNRSSIAGVVLLSPSDPVLERLDPSRLRTPWVIEVEPRLIPGDDRALQHPIALAVNHLADLGHERFFHIGGPTEWPSGHNRAVVYREVLARRGLRDCGSTDGPWGAPTGHAAMDSYPLNDAPTAIVAASDQLALGVLAWLAERGLKAPGDVSITGYDGLTDAAYYHPGLTTVAVDFAGMGARAVQGLLDGHSLRAVPVWDDYWIDAQLVVRPSTAAPGQGIHHF